MLWIQILPVSLSLFQLIKPAYTISIDPTDNSVPTAIGVYFYKTHVLFDLGTSLLRIFS